MPSLIDSDTGDDSHRRVNSLNIFVVVVPLAVQIISHVDDVVDDLGDLLDRKLFQVPIRCWSGDGETLLFGEDPTKSCEKS